MPTSTSDLALRKATMLALAVPGLSFIVYQRDWPPLMVSHCSATAPPGEVWMALCPAMFRDALCGGFDGDARQVVGPALGSDDCDVQIDVVPSDQATIDAAGVFSVTDEAGSCIVGFVASADHGLFKPVPEPVEQPLPCGRSLWLAPPDIVEIDHDLGMAAAGWRHLRKDQERARSVEKVALETLLALTVDELAQSLDTGDGAG